MISIDELRQQLSAQYNIKCFTDLAEISVTPGQAYQHLQKCHQEVFNDCDRLVFYTHESISDELIKHLYQATDLIDISNFFVLICNPYDISYRIRALADLHSADKSPFQTLKLNLEKTIDIQNNFFVPDTICPIPWMNLEISSSGDIRPCCVYSHSIGNINQGSLNESFHSVQMSSLRKEMLAGGAPTGCQYCWGLESEGLTSNRTYYMSLLKKELLTSNLESPVIKSLDLKPSNTCNFKCRICNPKSSSLFAQEAGISVKQFRWAEKDSKTIDEIINLLPTLINIDMFGGEPFLIKPLLKILSTAVDLGYANNIRLHYNSNGSIYPENLIEYWKKFKHVDIHFSIDNIGDRFELERGGSWAIVESNIKKLISLNLPNVKISIMPAISIMNIFYFDELIQFANKLNLSVNPLYVSKPSGFDIKNLTAEAKQLINEKFKHHQWTEIKNILNYINKLPDSNGKEFINLCKHFDNLRNQNFSKSHPEIAKAMGYI